MEELEFETLKLIPKAMYLTAMLYWKGRNFTVCYGITSFLVFTVVFLCVLGEGHAPCLQMPVKGDALWGH